jgi:hypothetical protein
MPPARTARGQWRIGGLTLDAGPICFGLGAIGSLGPVGVRGHWPNASLSASESGRRAALIAAAAPSMSYSIR